MQQHDDVVNQARHRILQGRAGEAIELLSGQEAIGVDAAGQLVLGDAHRAVGDFAAALEVYAQIAPTAENTAALAYRTGQVHHAQGDPRRALEIYGRADPANADPVDHAWLLVGISTAHWLLGERDEALAQARAAGARAAISGDPGVRAAAHMATALTVSLCGDPATVDEEYAHAARHAAAAGDLVLLARIQACRSHHLLADARFTEAVEVAAAAGAAAERFASPLALSVALENEAEGLCRLGRYDDASRQCERVRSLAGQIGTQHTAGALIILAQIHLRRGCREQARAALEQALRLQGDRPDRQVRVPALALLAITLLPEEVSHASELAAEALQEATGSQRLPALLAAGRTAWARGRFADAESLATQAVEHARARRERAWLAEALEFRATTADRFRARAALSEALQIWQVAGASHDADRVLVQLARLRPSAPDRVAARLALARLGAAGVLGMVRHVVDSAAGRVRIVTLGRFDVLVDGVAVPQDAWQSRRARDLLRLLICRRGRAIPRLEICEALWPDDDPVRTNHRLSVLLSIVRGVVGSDAILSDQACVALDLSRIEVDVEQFLADVGDAAALHERGEESDAATLLAQAVDSYADDPFADAPYDDAATPLRDEARSAYLQALRMLAQWRRRGGSYDQAAAYLRRLLSADRYDEDAYRTLIATLNRSGRHGQARVAAARYRAAMAEIGLRPAV